MPRYRWIRGYEGKYAVSDTGEVMSYAVEYDGKLMKPHLNTYGYYEVALYRDRERSRKLIHRLVARAFIPNPENKQVVSHLSGVRTDNRVGNLEWNCFISQEKRVV